MNRRSFLKDMLKAGVACTFLPGAGRIWKPTTEVVSVRFFVPKPSRLDLDSMITLIYEIKRKRERQDGQIDIFTDRYLVENFSGLEMPKVPETLYTEPPKVFFSEKHDPLSFKTVGVWEQLRNA